MTIVTPASNGGAGVQGTVAVLSRLRIYGEWTYIAAGRVQYNQDYYLSAASPTTVQNSINARVSSYTAGGGVQFLLPNKNLPKLVPYLVGGAGIVGERGGLIASVIGSQPWLSSSASFLTTRHSLNGSFGVRYYFTERAGLRFELQGYAPDNRFGRIAYGFFYQFR